MSNRFKNLHVKLLNFYYKDMSTAKLNNKTFGIKVHIKHFVIKSQETNNEIKIISEPWRKCCC